MPRARSNPLYDALRSRTHKFNATDLAGLLAHADKNRIEKMSIDIGKYVSEYLPRVISGRNGLSDYRANPYVLTTSANILRLEKPEVFARFLFNTKLYMALETSFGKSIESALLSSYPIDSSANWEDPDEKIEEFKKLEGLSREDRARERTASVWREIDRSCIKGNCRYLVSVKSGPNTINDSQVQAMTQAIIEHHQKWLLVSRRRNPKVKRLDIVIGLSYGTEKTTNNKENQIIIKLLNKGFVEEDRENKPGVIIDSKTRSIRVYRVIGKEFWGFIGNPTNPTQSEYVFLEVLLALARALSHGMPTKTIEEAINERLQALSSALSKLRLPKGSLPPWISDQFNENELFWLMTSLTSFYDEGI